MKVKVVEQLQEMLKGVTTVEDFDEMKRLIDEAKGKFLREPTLGFWEAKVPCWEMSHCPKAIRNECPAFKYRTLPCWQIEGTYRKVFDYEQGGDGTAVCRLCSVYKRWGHGEPIEIKLLVKEFNPAGKTVLK